MSVDPVHVLPSLSAPSPSPISSRSPSASIAPAFTFARGSTLLSVRNQALLKGPFLRTTSPLSPASSIDPSPATVETNCAPDPPHGVAGLRVDTLERSLLLLKHRE